MGAPTVNYFRGLAGATAAAAVAEGGTKPTSTPTWESVSIAVRKIAHIATATDEVVADFSSFSQFMGSELIAGLIDAENNALLNGSGVAPNLLGLLNATGILTRARGTDSRGDALRKAMTDIRTGSTFAEATGMILHPSDYQTIALEKDANSRYINIDSPINDVAGPSRMWGLPVVQTTKMPVGTALVGNFEIGSRLFVREAPRFEVNTQGGLTEWSQDLVLYRAEERLAVGTPRPAALVKVTGL